MSASYAIFLFSFNRAEFLANCVRSIDICVPKNVPVFIIDDNSSDPETKKVLGNIASRHKVLLNDAAGHVEVKTGGLYGAMNKAMEIAQKEEFDLAIFIQDDMQFIRHLGAFEIGEYGKYFAEMPNSIQLSTSFVRERSSDTFLTDHEICVSSGAYIRRRDRESGKSNFSATGVFSVDRFHKIFNVFEAGEGQNSIKAQRLGLVSGRSVHPNMCWLPYPISYRGKKRSFRHRFFERFGRSGFYPIKLMTDVEARAFKERDLRMLPIMERFLVAPSAPRQDVWSTGGGEYNFVCYGGLLSKIFLRVKKVKRRLRRILGS